MAAPGGGGGLLARVPVRWGPALQPVLPAQCHPGKIQETPEPGEQAGSPGNWLGPWAGRWKANKKQENLESQEEATGRGGSGDITLRAMPDPVHTRRGCRELGRPPRKWDHRTV